MNFLSAMVYLFAAFLIGTVSGAWFFVGSVKYDKLIAECEKHLPRNQRCEIVAVPVQGDKKLHRKEIRNDTRRD